MRNLHWHSVILEESRNCGTTKNLFVLVPALIRCAENVGAARLRGTVPEGVPVNTAE